MRQWVSWISKVLEIYAGFFNVFIQTFERKRYGLLIKGQEFNRNKKNKSRSSVVCIGIGTILICQLRRQIQQYEIIDLLPTSIDKIFKFSFIIISNKLIKKLFILITLVVVCDGLSNPRRSMFEGVFDYHRYDAFLKDFKLKNI